MLSPAILQHHHSEHLHLTAVQSCPTEPVQCQKFVKAASLKATGQGAQLPIPRRDLPRFPEQYKVFWRTRECNRRAGSCLPCTTGAIYKSYEASSKKKEGLGAQLYERCDVFFVIIWHPVHLKIPGQIVFGGLNNKACHLRNPTSYLGRHRPDQWLGDPRRCYRLRHQRRPQQRLDRVARASLREQTHLG